MLGEGMLRGLFETARNFFGSFYASSRLTTVSYPEERLPQMERARVFPFLIYDGEDASAGLRCVSCQFCEREGPPGCIRIEKSRDKKPDALGKPQFYPVRFEIDLSVCMGCQICAEVCPFDAIRMDTDYALCTEDRFAGLLRGREALSRSNAYYHSIHPLEAAETDARLEADRLRAAAKSTAAKNAGAGEGAGA